MPLFAINLIDVRDSKTEQGRVSPISAGRAASIGPKRAVLGEELALVGKTSRIGGVTRKDLQIG